MINYSVNRTKKLFAEEFGISVRYNFYTGDEARHITAQVPINPDGLEVIPHYDASFSDISNSECGPILSFYADSEYIFSLRHVKDGGYDAFINRFLGYSVKMGLKFALLLELAERGFYGFHALTMVCPSSDGKTERTVLLSAPSGTGKSTHGELWRTHLGAQILNGDYAFLEANPQKAAQPDKSVREFGTYFRGTPFCGSSSYAQSGKRRVDDIVFLRQAPHNSVKRLGGMVAYKNMLENAFVPFWDEHKAQFVLDSIAVTLDDVRIWQLDCTAEPEAALTLRDAIFQTAGTADKTEAAVTVKP